MTDPDLGQWWGSKPLIFRAFGFIIYVTKNNSLLYSELMRRGYSITVWEQNMIQSDRRVMFDCRTDDT